LENEIWKKVAQKKGAPDAAAEAAEVSKEMDVPEMRVSHDTIYQSLFVQGRGELRRELARCSRSGRTTRRPRGWVERRGGLRGWS
jgi:IS30 family transposase